MNYNFQNDRTILRNAFMQISNLVKLERYEEAVDTAKKLTGILKAFETRKRVEGFNTKK